ncbi:hypothetical protein [Leptothermofonsia sp. ETS-13]|uniref:hypothetical protein n=1 Tax=Leptothermofonsia sp. ETS-13 TaxID=3035696 RepID=UPI003BA22E10
MKSESQIAWSTSHIAWYSSTRVRQDIGIREGVGASPPARSRTPAPRPNHNDYRYKTKIYASFRSDLEAFQVASDFFAASGLNKS